MRPQRPEAEAVPKLGSPVVPAKNRVADNMKNLPGQCRSWVGKRESPERSQPRQVAY